MSSDSFTLVLVRHAKSSWEHPELPDIERPLNDRGRRAAPAMARWLAGQGVPPDLIVASPAVRARSTAVYFAEALGGSPGDIVIERDLYFEGTHGMLRTLERVDDRNRCVMMVGHNPTMTDLLNGLTGAGIANIPTCGVAVVGFDMPSWGLVDATRGQLRSYRVPKDLEGD